MEQDRFIRQRATDTVRVKERENDKDKERTRQERVVFSCGFRPEGVLPAARGLSLRRPTDNWSPLLMVLRRDWMGRCRLHVN